MLYSALVMYLCLFWGRNNHLSRSRNTFPSVLRSLESWRILKGKYFAFRYTACCSREKASCGRNESPTPHGVE